MICKKCGENLPDNARECFTCGAKVKKDVTTSAKNDQGAPTPALKKQLSAGKLFSDMFSSSEYFMMCLFVTLYSLFGAISMLESVIIGDWTNVASSAIDIAVNFLLVIPMWRMYIISKTKVAADYVKPFRFFRIYTTVRMVSAVPSLVIATVICLFAGFMIGELVEMIISCIVVVVLSILPSYVAFKFSGSLEKSAINDRIQLKGIGGLRGVQLTFAIILTIFSPMLVISLVSSILHFESLSEIMGGLQAILLMIILFQVSDWLKGIIKKVEQQ